MKFELVTPSRPRYWVPTSFQPCHTAVTAVTAGVLWRLDRPMLRDEGRILRPGHAVPYTTHLPCPGDRHGRPSWPW